VSADAQKSVAAVAAQAAARPRGATALFEPPDTGGVDDYLPAGVAHRREFHPHESPWLMTVPLVILAFAAIVAGALNLPFTDRLQFLERWLEPVLEHPHEISFGGAQLWILAIIATAGAALGILVSYSVYLKGKVDPRTVEQPAFAHGWYYDELVTRFMGGPGRKLFDLAALFDRVVIDGAVNGVATAVRGSGNVLRRVQTGFVRSYAVGVALGAFLLMGYFFLARVS
jgi:NADH-quinone oxidoreductase subunit L